MSVRMQKDQRNYAIQRVQIIAQQKCNIIADVDKDIKLTEETLNSIEYAKLFNVGKLPRLKVTRIYDHTSARNLFVFPKIKVDPKIKKKQDAVHKEEMHIVDQIMLGDVETALALINNFENRR